MSPLVLGGSVLRLRVRVLFEEYEGKDNPRRNNRYEGRWTFSSEELGKPRFTALKDVPMLLKFR